MGTGSRWVALLAVGLTACGTATEAAPPSLGTVALSELPDRPVTAQSTPAGPAATSGATSAAVAVAEVAVATEGAVRVAPPVPQPGEVTFAFTGDTLIHSPLVNRASGNAGGNGYDFGPMFARIAPMVSAADVAVCHLETPVAPPGEALSTFPLYGIPAEITTALAASGYDRCSTASNHTLDRGTAGIDATINALHGAGLGQSGMASAPTDIEPQPFPVHGVSIAHLSYTYGFNGIALPAGQLWRSAVIDPERIINDATTARQRGARLVIVSLHWGEERSAVVTASQRQVAEAITASGLIDLVVGHHAHVLQPIEQINGVWVVFGLGNIVSNLGAIDGWPGGVADGVVLSVSFVEQPDGSYAVVTPPVAEPTWVDINAGWIVRPVLTDLADPSTAPNVRTELEHSLARTSGVLGPFIPS